jgi:PAS domain S-box-containing protein
MKKTNRINIDNPKILEKMFSQAFANSLIGMAILDQNGKFIQVNKTFTKILGYTNTEVVGKSWREITHPDDMEKSICFVESYKNQDQLPNH